MICIRTSKQTGAFCNAAGHGTPYDKTATNMVINAAFHKKFKRFACCCHLQLVSVVNIDFAAEDTANQAYQHGPEDAKIPYLPRLRPL
jgi:hypothetical protein